MYNLIIAQIIQRSAISPTDMMGRVIQEGDVAPDVTAGPQLISLFGLSIFVKNMASAK